MSQSLGNQSQYAGFWYRAGAAVIDCLILTIVGYVILFFLLQGLSIWSTLNHIARSDAELLWNTVTFWTRVILGGIYCVSFESSVLQATPGKLVFGLRLYAVTGHNITFFRAWNRYLSKLLYFAVSILLITIVTIDTYTFHYWLALKLFYVCLASLVLSFIACIVGHAMIFKSAKKQTFHDWLSGVVVVKKSAMGQMVHFHEQTPAETRSTLFS